MTVPTDAERQGPDPEGPPGDGPKTLADLQTPLRMTRIGWLIAIMIVVAMVAFFIVVVCLGVDNS